MAADANENTQGGNVGGTEKHIPGIETTCFNNVMKRSEILLQT
jgi:hypothetical protein